MHYVFGLADMHRPAALYDSVRSFTRQADAKVEFVLCCRPQDFEGVSALLSRLQHPGLQLRSQDPMLILSSLLASAELSRLSFWDTAMQFHPWRLAKQCDYSGVTFVQTCWWHFALSDELYVADMKTMPAPVRVFPGTLSVPAEKLMPVNRSHKSPADYALGYARGAYAALEEHYWAVYGVPRILQTYTQARGIVTSQTSGRSAAWVRSQRTLFLMFKQWYNFRKAGEVGAPEKLTVSGHDGIGFDLHVSEPEGTPPPDIEQDWTTNDPDSPQSP